MNAYGLGNVIYLLVFGRATLMLMEKKIEFTSAKNEGWLFDIKTKKCVIVLNDKVENINHSGKNRLRKQSKC